MLLMPKEAARAIGALCVAGDAACERGSLVELEAIAAMLAEYFGEPLHCELAELASVCRADPAGAMEVWRRMKDHVFQRSS